MPLANKQEAFLFGNIKSLKSIPPYYDIHFEHLRHLQFCPVISLPELSVLRLVLSYDLECVQIPHLKSQNHSRKETFELKNRIENPHKARSLLHLQLIHLLQNQLIPIPNLQVIRPLLEQS